MKHLISILILTILISAFSFAQSQDSVMNQVEKKQTVEEKKTDKFIDRDGDGICDERAQGFGFKRWRYSEEQQQSKDQKAQSGKSSSTSTIQPTGTGAGNQKRGGKQK